MRNVYPGMCLLAAVAVGALCGGAPRAAAAHFTQADLVSDISGLASLTDAGLKNPWGLSHSPTSPFWISNQLTGTATLYAVTDGTTVMKVPLTVSIPTTTTEPQGPTGQVNNTNPSSFPVDGAPAAFIFADLNGTISAWNKNAGTAAVVVATTPGAIYTGLAINGAQTRLYAANDAGPPGSIDVFDSAFKPVALASGAFVDPALPAGLVPFNVEDIGGDVYVTYAPPGHGAQTTAKFGQGAVAIFKENGIFIKQLIEGGRLAAPWGIAMAPAGFGRFSNHLLVGNFSYSHSEINAFGPTNGKYHGTLRVDAGGLPPGGLWALAFGVGGSNGSPHTLYFTDGINSEMDGLFGAIFRAEGR